MHLAAEGARSVLIVDAPADQLGTDALDERGRRFEEIGVGPRQKDFLARAAPSRLMPRLSRPDDHHIDAESAEALGLRCLETPPKAEQDDERGDPPEDPEEREAAPEPVAREVARRVKQHGRASW